MDEHFKYFIRQFDVDFNEVYKKGIYIYKYFE